MIADDQPDPLYAPAAPPRRRWTPTLLLALLMFLAGIAAMIWALGDDRVRTLVARDQPLVTRPAAMVQPAAIPSPIVPPADPVAVETAEALDQRVASLEARIDQVGRRAQAAAGDAARAEGLLVAFAARRALDRGLGLGYLEGQLNQRFAPTQPRAVATIIAAARDPVTVEDLQLALEEVAPRLGSGAPGEGVVAGLRRSLAELMVIRRVGTPSPLADERLARARRMLEGGRVDTAMAEIARMPGRGQAIDWLTDARRYVSARRALDVIETAAIAEGPPRPPLPVAADAAPSAMPQPPVATDPSPVAR